MQDKTALCWNLINTFMTFKKNAFFKLKLCLFYGFS